jgi:hypothetical protein
MSEAAERGRGDVKETGSSIQRQITAGVSLLMAIGYN